MLKKIQNWFSEQPSKTLLVGGITTTGVLVGGFLIYVSFFGSKRASGKCMEKEKLVLILKRIKRDIYPMLFNISMMTRNMQRQYRGSIPKEELKKIILNENPQFNSFMKSMMDAIFAHFETNGNDYEASLLKYESEPEVILMNHEINQSIENAIEGICDTVAEVPEFMTPEKTLKIFRRHLNEASLEILNVILKMREQGYSVEDLKNPKIMEKFEETKLEDLRNKVLVEEGLNEYEDHPSKIFQNALQKYGSSERGFQQKVLVMNDTHEAIMSRIMKASLEELKEMKKKLIETRVFKTIQKQRHGNESYLRKADQKGPRRVQRMGQRK